MCYTDKLGSLCCALRLMTNSYPQICLTDEQTTLTPENMGSFLAKSTTRVMAGVTIFVNSLKASRSTLSPSEVGTIGPCPISSGYKKEITNVRGKIPH